MTLELWQTNPALVKWAQDEPNFRLFVTLLTTERTQAYVQDGASENRLLGRSEGYERAVQVALNCSVSPVPAASDLGQPDYAKENNSETVNDA